MKGIILNHPEDIKLFNKYDKKINFYAYNYHTYLHLKNKIKKISYLNDKLILKNFDDFSQIVSMNWYKKNRKNNLKSKKISIGNIILPKLLNEFSNSLKNYFKIE